MNLAFFDKFPRLETERLELRELCDEDVRGVFEVFSDAEVTRYYDVDTMTDARSAAQLLLEMRQRFVRRVGIRWAVVDKHGKSFIGTVGFNSINSAAYRVTIGYELARRAWGRGFATEAVCAAVRFGHDEVGLERIEAAVMLGNEASVRVLRKAGFAEDGVLRGAGYWKGQHHDLRMFSIRR